MRQAGPNNYTINNPGVKWSCWEKGSNGNPLVNKTTGYLTACPIDTGDNAWMLASATTVSMMTPGGMAIFYIWSYKTKECSKHTHDGFHNDRNNWHTMGVMGV